MFRIRLHNIYRNVSKCKKMLISWTPRKIVSAGLLTVICEQNQHNHIGWNDESLGHEFLIKQATTVNVNAATQLLTVTLVAVQDTSER